MHMKLHLDDLKIDMNANNAYIRSRVLVLLISHYIPSLLLLL